MNNPVIITKRNTDSESNPISVSLIETRQISDGAFIVLKQVPDELYRVNVQGYTEVFDVERLKVHEFKVDYSQGVVYFHPKATGKTVVVEYYGIGYELISASRIFTKYDKYGNAIETLEDVIDSVYKIKPTLDRISKSEELIDQIHSDLDKAEIIMPQLNELVTEGERVKEELDEVINAAQDDINTIKAAGNTEVLINVDEWVLNGTMYEKEITHDLNSENVHVSFKNADTKEGATIGYKIIDKTRILLKSDEAINLSVTLSASYYKPLINTDVDEGEIVGAREGKASLRDNMIRKINYKPFTADRLYEG